MKTLSKTITISGIGIHSGNEVTINIAPSTTPGINFYFKNTLIPVNLSTVATNHIRSTQVSHNGITVQTPEHMLSACYALQLTNIDITLSAAEFPILDGSSFEFIKALEPYAITVSQAQKPLAILSDLHYEINGSHYFASPAENYSIHGVISYPNHWIQSMSYTYQHSYENYKKEISKARTYGFTHEIEALHKNGLAKGGSLDNALVIGDNDYINEPRFNNELVRHKILDFIGDMAILNRQFKGKFTIIKPSHQGNISFLKLLSEETN